MEKNHIQRIASHVAASYVSRELDRVWLDRLMATKLGTQLKSLSKTEQKALELIAYLSSAYVVHSDANPSAIRSFLNTVLSDIPPELAKRMMSQDEPPDTKTAILLLEHLDDHDLQTISDIPANNTNRTTEPSLAVKLRDKIEMSRTAMRQNRRLIGRRK
jgi:hypothetical protein